MADNDHSEEQKQFLEHERTLSYSERAQRMNDMDAQGRDHTNLEHRHEHHKTLVRQSQSQPESDPQKDVIGKNLVKQEQKGGE